MTEQSKAQRRASRERRLGAALRENLKRRKAQARGRGSAAESEAGSPHVRGERKPKDES
jgi:hypothetical protein